VVALELVRRWSGDVGGVGIQPPHGCFGATRRLLDLSCTNEF
jgi:hypothetical protein